MKDKYMFVLSYAKSENKGSGAGKEIDKESNEHEKEKEKVQEYIVQTHTLEEKKKWMSALREQVQERRQVYKSVQPSIHPSIYLSIHIYLSIYPSICLSIYLSTDLPIYHTCIYSTWICESILELFFFFLPSFLPFISLLACSFLSLPFSSFYRSLFDYLLIFHYIRFVLVQSAS